MTAPELLKRQMPSIREIESILEFYGYTKGTPEWLEMFNYQILFYRKFAGKCNEQIESFCPDWVLLGTLCLLFSSCIQ